MSLRAIPVERPDQIERVRQIRNVCAWGFSNFNGEISPEAQADFWEREQPMAWLYADEQNTIVGFGMLRKDDEGRWCTVAAVLPEHAGHNYGREITHDTVVRCPGRAWASARRDNPGAVKLHPESDWEVIDGPDPRLIYFRTWTENAKWPGEGAKEQWAVDGWVVGS